MGVSGGCHCGAVRYEVEGEPITHALCHCTDCRRSAGAPMVGWAMFPTGALRFSGEVATYASSAHGRRSFCPRCGTGLFYTNEEMLPGITDVQSATLDDQERFPAAILIQTADRAPWVAHVHELPGFERFPPSG